MLALQWAAHALSSSIQCAALRFRRTKDRFFLIVFSSDPKYKPTEVRSFLESLRPRSISEVPD